MAKVTQPLGSIEARGSVGGLVYQPWRGIQTVRARVGPASQASEKRAAIRALLASVAAEWRALSDQQRENWTQYALLHLDPYWTGEDIRLPGFHRFCRMAFLAQWSGSPPFTDPPIEVERNQIENLALVDFGGYLLVTWDYDQSPGGLMPQVDLWAAIDHSPGKQCTLKDARHIAFSDADSLSWPSPWPSVGTYTCFARPIWTTGQTNPWISTRGTFPE